MNRLVEKLSGFKVERDNDARDRLLEDAEEEQLAISRGLELKRLSYCYVVLAAVGLSLLSAFIGIFASHRWLHHNVDSICLAHTSQGSPLPSDIDITYSKVQFNGSLLKENIYRQPASPEVDAAWSALGVDFHSVVVPASLGDHVGFTPSHVKINPKYGGGFPANVEGLHQLHCLNLVRQALWYNFDYYYEMGEGPFKNSDYILRKHVSHCLDIVRQQLMCTVDIGVLGQVWFQPSMAEYPEAYVDFNTKHVCRDFEAVRSWALEHQIPDDVPEDFLEPPKEGDKIYRTIP